MGDNQQRHNEWLFSFPSKIKHLVITRRPKDYVQHPRLCLGILKTLVCEGCTFVCQDHMLSIVHHPLFTLLFTVTNHIFAHIEVDEVDFCVNCGRQIEDKQEHQTLKTTNNEWQ